MFQFLDVLILLGIVAVFASACLVVVPMVRVRVQSGGYGIYPGHIRDVALSVSMVLVLVPTAALASYGSRTELVISLFAVALHGGLLASFRVKTAEEAEAVDGPAGRLSPDHSDLAHGEPRDC